MTPTESKPLWYEYDGIRICGPHEIARLDAMADIVDPVAFVSAAKEMATFIATFAEAQQEYLGIQCSGDLLHYAHQVQQAVTGEGDPR